MHVSNKKFGCRILVHRKDFKAANPRVVYEQRGLNFKTYTKFRWYFRYRAALFQVKYPKQEVELSEYNYVYTPPLEEKIRSIKNKLRSAKGKVTSWNRKLEDYLENNNTLFPEDNPFYKKAVAKVAKKQLEVIELSNQLQELMSREAAAGG